MPNYQWSIAVLLCVFLGGRCWASEALPLSVPGVLLVSAKEVSELPPAAKLVDVRPLHDHFSARIPNSLHIAYRERSVRTQAFDPSVDDVPAFLTRLHKLIPDRKSYVVLYCNGLQCWKSYKAATAAVKDGYQHIGWFRGGIAEWEMKGLPIQAD
jgi:rhodanese-related sulfurtransferase